MIYSDTSFILAIYLQSDPFHAQAIKIAARLQEPIPLTLLGELELVNGVRRNLTARIINQREHDAIFRQISADEAEGILCSKWNRNRVIAAQSIEGVPVLTPEQRAAMDLLDGILRRPRLMYATYLRPGDMQMLNNHVTLHSRTSFEDHDDPMLKRCLFRLWLAPPDWPALPESWRPAYGSVAAGTVRGGIVGRAYDETQRAFEARQAADLGMRASAV